MPREVDDFSSQQSTKEDLSDKIATGVFISFYNLIFFVHKDTFKFLKYVDSKVPR